MTATSFSALAHEVRPAYLQITEGSDQHYQILWKQPVMGEMAVHLAPHLSSGWLKEKPASVETTASFAIKTWNIAPARDAALEGQTVSIEGLENTITDAFVVIRLADGSQSRIILTPTRTSETLHLSSRSASSLTGFLSLGIEHILTGIDHLLFVLGLLLIVRDRWTLLKTVTAFTVAHSLTLAAATLGYVQAPVPFVNAAIALSILFLGPEIVRRWRGGTSLAIRYPWVIAFAFGLLHGFGFASGLSAVGLPRHDIPLALLLFNVGVEIGQLAFVLLILWLAHAFEVLAIRWPTVVQRLPGYTVGVLGAFWTIQRVALLFAGGV